MHGGPHSIRHLPSPASWAAPEPPGPLGFAGLEANPLPPASQLAGPSPTCRPSPPRGDPRASADPSGPVSSQEKSKRLEVELDEERTTVELLTERVGRSREQVGQAAPPRAQGAACSGAGVQPASGATPVDGSLASSPEPSVTLNAIEVTVADELARAQTEIMEARCKKKKKKTNPRNALKLQGEVGVCAGSWGLN